MKPTLASLLAVVLLAGCFKADGPDEPGQATSSQSTSASVTNTATGQPPDPCGDNCTSPPGPATIEGLDCTFYLWNFAADAAKVSALLPEGFALDANAPATTVRALFKHCESIVVDNSTVSQDVYWYQAVVSVASPEEVASGRGDDVYALETMTSDLVLQTRWTELGFEVLPADIAWSLSAPLSELQVTSGAINYDLQVSGDADPPTGAILDDYRVHRKIESTAYWFEGETRAAQGSLSGLTGTGTVTGGVLGHLALAGQALVAHSPYGTSTERYTFGSLQMET